MKTWHSVLPEVPADCYTRILSFTNLSTFWILLSLLLLLLLWLFHYSVWHKLKSSHVWNEAGDDSSTWIRTHASLPVWAGLNLVESAVDLRDVYWCKLKQKLWTSQSASQDELPPPSFSSSALLWKKTGRSAATRCQSQPLDLSWALRRNCLSSPNRTKWIGQDFKRSWINNSTDVFISSSAPSGVSPKPHQCRMFETSAEIHLIHVSFL